MEPEVPEVSTHADFIQENLERRPVDECIITVHAVNHQSAASANVVDRVVGNLFCACRFDLRCVHGKMDFQALCRVGKCTALTTTSNP